MLLVISGCRTHKTELMAAICVFKFSSNVGSMCPEYWVVFLVLFEEAKEEVMRLMEDVEFSVLLFQLLHYEGQLSREDE